MAYHFHRNKKEVLFSTTWGFFIGFAAVVLFAPLTSALGLTHQQKALLVGISSLTGSLLRIPFAAWVDSDGGRKPFLVLLLLAIIGMGGIYLLLGGDAADVRSKFGLLLLFGAFAGCGIATFSVGIGQTSYWFRQKEQGRALAVYAGLGNLAPGIFNFIISKALLRYDDQGRVLLESVRSVYLIWLIFLVVGTIIYLATTAPAWYFQARAQGASVEEATEAAKQQGQEIFPKGNLLVSLSTAAKIWQNWALVIVYFLGFGGFLALTNWFSLLFKDYHGMTVSQAAVWASVYSIGASLARVGTGPLADKMNCLLLVNLALLLTGIGALLFVVFSSLGVHITALLCMTVGMGAINAGVFKLVPRYIPHAVGGAAGWIGGLGAVGGFVLPQILAEFLGGGDEGYRQGFWVFVILSLICIGLMLLLHYTHQKEEARG